MDDAHEIKNLFDMLKNEEQHIKKMFENVLKLFNGYQLAKEEYLKDEQNEENKVAYETAEEAYKEANDKYLKLNIKHLEKISDVEQKYGLRALYNVSQAGGKRKSKANSKKVAKKPVVSQKKQSIYKEILGKKMKIYKMPDSRKEYVKYKGELLHIADYKNLMKQKAIAKTKTKVTKVTQKKAKSKTKK